MNVFNHWGLNLYVFPLAATESWVESASSEGAGSVLVVAESISSIRVFFFPKFPSLFDEELPNTEKYLFIFLFCLKSEFPATVTKPLLNVRMFGKCSFLVVEWNWRAYNSKYISLHASLPSCSHTLALSSAIESRTERGIFFRHGSFSPFRTGASGLVFIFARYIFQ